MFFGRKTILALRTKLFSRRIFQRKLREVVGRNRIRPRFELLEDRRVLATVTWDGGADTFNWDDALNWDGDAVPTPSDDAVIPDLTGTPTIFSNNGLNGPNTRSIVSAEKISLGSLTRLTTGAGTSSFLGGLDLQAQNVVSFGGPVTVDGGNWITAFVSGSYTNRGFLIIDHSGGGTPSFGSLTNSASGTLTLQNSTAITGTLVNQVGGQVFLTGVGSIGGSISNAGTLSRTTTLGTTIVSASLDNSGTVSSNRGTLNFTGTVAQLSGGTITGGTWSTAYQSAAVLDITNGASITTIGPNANVNMQAGSSSFPGIEGLADNRGIFYVRTPFVTAGPLTNSGSITIGSGSSLSVTGDYTQTAGVLQVGSPAGIPNGSFGSTTNVINILGGTLSGFGSIGGNVVVDGTLSPGFSPGILTINGNLTLSASSITNIEVAGTDPAPFAPEFDQILVTGSATLAGRLNISSINDFYLDKTESLTFLTYASRSGNFATTNVSSRNGLPLLALTPGATSYDTQGTAYVVRNTNDSGPFSLRNQIDNANANVGLDQVLFNLSTAGVQTYTPGTALSSIASPIIIDGTSQALYSVLGTPLIELDGTNAGPATNGLRLGVGSNGSIIKGLAINRFNAQGIYIDSLNNTISDNFIGTDTTGNVDRGNVGNGIYVSIGSNGNLIISNLVSGNNATGILLSGNSNKVKGNKVGTNAAGDADLGNGLSGVFMYEGSSNIVGVDGNGLSDANEGNLISGNDTYGVYFQGNADNNIVAGNLIGTNLAGTGQRGNSLGGISFFNDFQSDNNRIGTDANGTSDDLERNIISGNLNYGLVDFGVGTKIAGNYVGTQIDGLSALPNAQGGVSLGSSNATVGGTALAARNVISGNAGFGLAISLASGTANKVLGNYIGVDKNGILPLANTSQGVWIQTGANNNTIGGTTESARNVISGNTASGVLIDGVGTSANMIFGNYIGVGADGSTDVGNSNGVLVQNGANGNFIGGGAIGAGNVIAGNAGDVTLSGADQNKVQGNRISVNAGETAVIAPSFGYGITLVASAARNVIGTDSDGTTDDSEGNIIGYASTAGILLQNNTGSPDKTVIAGNRIGLASNGTTLLNSGGIRGIWLQGATDTRIGSNADGANDDNEGNVIVNTLNSNSILLTDGTDRTLIAGNYLGTNATGTAGLATGGTGIQVQSTTTPVTNTVIGGSSDAARNVIGSMTYGIILSGAAASGTSILGNRIGTDKDGTAPIGNVTGISIENTTNITIGGTAFGAGNVISGNSGKGIDLFGVGTSNINILGNFIGTSADGTAALGNGSDGIHIESGVANTTIGGTTEAARNIISNNSGNGVYIGPTVTGTVIQGNFIGVDESGTAPFGNVQDGIQTASPVQIGGLTATPGTGAGNVISGNGNNTLNNYGNIYNGGAAGVVIQGNIVGLDKDGANVIRQNTQYGIWNFLADGTTIGGATTAARNVISGNGAHGLLLQGGSGLLVQNNFIGTDISGDLDKGNTLYGISTDTKNSTFRSNVISGNDVVGFSISGIAPDATNIQVFGNIIGLNAAGAAKLGNTNNGLEINGASSITVGGTTAADRNIISGNDSSGISISGGAATTGIVVQGNYIGQGADGTTTLGNAQSGIAVTGAATSGVTIGGTASGTGNVISGNANQGILLAGAISTLVLGNFIGTDKTGRLAKPNAVGVQISGGAINNTIGGSALGARNIVSGNNGNGVLINSSGNNAVYGNYIGTDSSGLLSLGNTGGAGVEIIDSPNTKIGGGANGQGNVIGANHVSVTGASSGTRIQGNIIGADKAGAVPLSNTYNVALGAASGVYIGTDSDGNNDSTEGNVIAITYTAGVFIAGNGGTANANVIAGNLIGTAKSGDAVLNNTSGRGIWIDSATNTRIGGQSRDERNVINSTGGGSSGILISDSSSTGANGNFVQGNYVGFATNGSTILSNNNSNLGIFLSANTGQNVSNNTIGGIATGAANLIGGWGTSVAMDGVGVKNNSIVGNFVGYASVEAISLGSSAANNIILSNSIGITPAGNPMPNARGIHVLASAGANSISDNRIRFSTGDNILVEAPLIVLRRNVSADMGGLPIKLEPASLKPGTVTITQAVGGANALAVVTVTEARPSTNYTVDFFSSTISGQASQYISSGTVSTDTFGNASASITLATGQLNGYLHATLTELGLSGEINTSALSSGVLSTPAIILGLPSKSPEGTPITLTAFSSTNVVTGYLWEVKKDGLPYAFELRTDGTQNDGGIQFTPDDEGDYTVSLRATIADGTPNGTQFILGPFNIEVYNVAPTPSFAYTPTAINAGSVVTLSSNNSDPGQLDVLKNAWEVRSGSPSGPIVFSAPLTTVQTASFTPSAGGFYFATMTVDDGDGGVRTLTREIEVSGLPSAASTTIVVPNTTVLEGQTVRARAPESELNRSEQLTFTWTVSKKSPNGVITDYTPRITTPSRGVVEFIPDDDGVYTIGLTIGDGVGSVTAIPQTVTVSNVAPRIQITGGAIILTAGVPVTLGTSIVDPSTSDTQAIVWSVTHDGSPFGVPASGTAFTFTPNLSGNYIVTATATDDDGGVATTRRAFSLSTTGVSVAIVPPIGPFLENNTYNFSATVPAGASTYLWTARNVTGVQAATGTSPTFNFAPQQGGSYQIELQVTFADGRVGNAIYLPMVVSGAAPTISSPLAVLSPTGAIDEGTTVTVGTLATDPRETVGLTYQWSLKKPNESTFTSLSGMDGAPTSFRFLPTDNGIYQVQVTIADSQGLSVSQFLDVPVQNADPLVRLDATYNPSTPNDITFTALTTDPGSADTPDLKYEWKVNNGSYTAISAINQFATLLTGLSNLTVRVTDGDGGVTLRSYFILQGTNNDDVYTITATNTANAGANDQILYLALDGNDTITIDSSVTKKVVVIAGNGNDIVDAHTASVEVILDGGIGNDTLLGGSADDILIAGTETNFLDGGNGNNRFVGGGSDRMKDGVGNSIFEVHFSTVALEDAGGVDTIDLTAAQAGVTLNLSINSGTAQPVFQNSIPPNTSNPPVYANSTLSLNGSFEKLIGSTFDDVLETNTLGTEINGGSGNDTIVSSALDTKINGGVGADSIVLRNSAGTIDGGEGNDTISGTLAASSSTVIATGTGNDTVAIDGTSTIVNILGVPTTVYSDVSISLGEGTNSLTANKISGKIYGNNGSKGLIDAFGQSTTSVSAIDVSSSSNVDIFGTSAPGSSIATSGSSNVDIFGSGEIDLLSVSFTTVRSTIFGTSAVAPTNTSVTNSSNVDIFGTSSASGPGLNVDVSGSSNVDIFGTSNPQSSTLTATGSSNVDIFGIVAGTVSVSRLTGTNRIYVSNFGTSASNSVSVAVDGSSNVDIFGSSSASSSVLNATISDGSSNVDIFGSSAPIGTIRVEGGSSNVDIFGTSGPIGSITIGGASNVDIFGTSAPIGTIKIDGSSYVDIFGSSAPIGSIRVEGGSSYVDIFGTSGPIQKITVDGSTNVDIFGSVLQNLNRLDVDVSGSSNVDIFGSSAGQDNIRVIASQNVDIYGLVSGQVEMIGVNRNGVGTAVIASTGFGTSNPGQLTVSVSGSQNVDIFGSSAPTGPSLDASVTSSANVDIFGSSAPGTITVTASQNVDIFGTSASGTTMQVIASQNVDIYGGYGDNITLRNVSLTRVEGGVFGTSGTQGITVAISDGSANVGIFGTSLKDDIAVGASSNVGVDLRGGNDVVEVDGAEHFVAITDDGVDRVTIRSGSDMLIYLGAGNDQAEVFGGQLIRVIGEAGVDEMMLAGGNSVVLDGGLDADQIVVTGGQGIYVRSDAGADQVDIYGGIGVSVSGGTETDTLRVFGSLGGVLDAGKVYALLDGQDGSDVLEVRPLLSVASRGTSTFASVAIPYLYIPTWMTIPAWISNPEKTTYASSIALVGGKGTNALYLEGAQRLYGIGGDDVDSITLQEGSSSEIAGGKSDDTITVNATGSDNRVFGDQDNDTIDAFAGTRLGIFGEEGTDTIRLHAGQDGFARGGINNDTLEILNGNRMVLAGESDDDTQTILGGTRGVAAGGLGDDTLDIRGGTLGLLLGQSGNDHLIESAGTNSILSGGDGDDKIDAYGRGNDLYGDDGDDIYVIHASTLTSVLRLRELIYVDPSDFEPESRGSDTIDLSEFSVSATLNLSLLGNFNDLIGGKDLTTGLQTVIGSQLQMILFGSLENIVGTSANDTLIGNSESNIIEGRGGNDFLNGLAGDDTLEGGTENDTIDGGNGDDLYMFSTTSGVPLGVDTIYEANGGGIDGLDFTGMPVGLGSLDMAIATQQNLNGGLLNLTLRQSGSSAGTAEIEEVVGTPFAETILGNSLDNRIEPKGGNDIVDGRTGSDIYVFAGRNLGSDQVLDAGVGTDRDTLDFVGFDAPIVLDLAVTSPQNMGELTLTLAAADSIENVIGSSFDDSILGNARDNALFGAAGADRLEGRSGNDRLVGDLQAVVLLDFDSAFNALRGDYNYSTTERALILQRLTATYSAFNWRFTLNETEARTWTADMGRSFVRIAFSKGRGGGVSGDAGEVDFRNIRRRVVTEVNINPLLPAIREMLGSTYTAQQYSDMVVAVTSTIAGHELAHTAGLRHGDSFGPIGSGMYSDTDTTNVYPPDTRPKNGTETGWHLMASPASVGTPLSDATRATFFGEREAIKMAFNEIGRTRRETESSIGSNDTWMLAEPIYTADALPRLYVPNMAPSSGFVRSGQSFDVSAMAVVGELSESAIVGVSDRDFYRFEAQVGDYLNVEVMASSIRPLRGSPFDGEVRLYNAAGVQIDFNDDDFEGTKDATIIDFLVTATGTYYVSVGLSAQPVFGTGGRYELFVSKFKTGNAANVVGDIFIGGAGNDTIVGGGADDVIFGAGASPTELDSIDGKGGYDTVDGQGLAYNYTVVGAPIENVVSTVNTPPTVSIQGPEDGLMNVAQTFTFTARDLDTLDSNGPFLFTILWGDSTQTTVTSSVGQNSISVTKTYASVSSSGKYVISATVKDSRNMTGPATTKSYASVGWKIMSDPANLGKTILVIVGSEGADLIRIREKCGDNLKVKIRELEENVRVRGLVSGDVDRILVFGLGGNDRITIDDDIDVNVEVWGGAGDDEIKGGSGNDILLGGAGADVIFGGNGRDLIFGGTGSDRLYGDAHDDILVAGFTAFDEEFNSLAPSVFAASARLAFNAQRQALEAILAEWTSSRNYTTRRNNILGTGTGTRLNGNYFLKATGSTITSNTVFDDGAKDRLWGDNGTDWFFANLDGDHQSAVDEVKDGSNGETCTDTDRWW